MRKLQAFIDSTKPNHVCKLSKVIYALKQAPRVWFDNQNNALLSQGFENMTYVDVIIATGNNTKFLQSFIKQLNIMCSLKDVGHLHYFLGIEVQREQLVCN